jgi:alkanesulfonate monooxygenase SsuD/methylene tetrahydromethanopterin reductase-like flavin-dependent oxidoreductase (luciferase family)
MHHERASDMTSESLAIGVFLPTMSPRGERPGDVVAAARHAEALGFESVWAVDQLIAGAGVPFLDSTVALATAAAVTSRVRLGFGVAILPLHSTVWLAKQVASLQYVSGDRVVLGVGAGGDRHEQSWRAAGVARSQRGARTDAALRVLPDLIAGRPTALEAAGPVVQLAPGSAIPPIVVGGASSAALRRTVEFGDGWFALPAPPEAIAATFSQLAEMAASRQRKQPTVTVSLMTALSPDASMPEQSRLHQRLSDPDGMFAIPEAAIPSVLHTGSPADLSRQIEAYAVAGVSRIVFSIAAGDWFRQTELIAEAHRRVAAQA